MLLAKQKSYKNNNKPKEVKEPISSLKKSNIKIFHSFEEQEEHELQQMAKLSPEEVLIHLRKLINLAYGMHGYNPNNLPKKHFIRIISNPNEHI